MIMSCITWSLCNFAVCCRRQLWGWMCESEQQLNRTPSWLLSFQRRFFQGCWWLRYSQVLYAYVKLCRTLAEYRAWCAFVVCCMYCELPVVYMCSIPVRRIATTPSYRMRDSRRCLDTSSPLLQLHSACHTHSCDSHAIYRWVLSTTAQLPL